MNRILYYVPILVLSVFVNSCGSETTDNGKIPVARVYDKVLYYDDLGNLVPEGTSSADSAVKVRSYIDSWARQQLMIKKAEINLSNEQKDVERQLEDYKASLLVFKYKEKFLSQELEENVSQSEAKEYYNAHLDDFKLSSAAVRAFFVQVPAAGEYLSAINNALNFHDSEDSLKLINLIKGNSYKFDAFSGNYVLLSAACALMPENIDDSDNNVRQCSLITQRDDFYVYYLKILDYIAAGNTAPFSLIEKSIDNVIVNKRKASLINELEQNIYDNAVSSGNLEYYDKK